MKTFFIFYLIGGAILFSFFSFVFFIPDSDAACGPCTGFASICDTSGTRSCTGTGSDFEPITYTQTCFRTTAGITCGEGKICTNGSCQLIAPISCTASCGTCGYSSGCDESGSQKCTRVDCTTYFQSCSTRDTDGLKCFIGSTGTCKGGFCVYPAPPPPLPPPPSQPPPATPVLSGGAICSSGSPQVSLSWSVSSASGISEYHIQRSGINIDSTDRDSTTSFAPTSPATDTASPFIDTNVFLNETYRYRISSHSHTDALYSSYSNIVQIDIPVSCEGPPPPPGEITHFFDFKTDVDPLFVNVGGTLVATLFSDLTLTSRDLPVEIVLVMDTSGSMSKDSGSGTTRLAEAKKAMKTFISLLDPKADRAGLVTFDGNNGGVIRSGLTNNFTQLNAIIDQLSAGGSTPMGQGLLAANTVISSARKEAGKFILFASDGHENILPSVLVVMDGCQPTEAGCPASGAPPVASDVTVHTIGIASDITTTANCGQITPCISGEETLTRLAHEAGTKQGKYFFAPDATKLSELYTNILKLIKERIFKSSQLKITVLPEFEFLSAEPAVSFKSNVSDGTLLTWSLGDLKTGASFTTKMTLRALQELPNQPQDINYPFTKSAISFIDNDDNLPGEEPVPVMHVTVVSGLDIACSPDRQNALLGDPVVWTASVTGGIAPYQYLWSGEKVDGNTQNPVTAKYDTKGNKTASVRVTDANGTVVSKPCDFGVNVIDIPALRVELTPIPSQGSGPLLSVSLRARLTVGYEPNQSVNYSFWWDCDSPAASVQGTSNACGPLPVPVPETCASNLNGAKCDGINSDTESVGHLYPNSSKIDTITFHPKVIAEQGRKTPDEDRSSVIVGPVPIPKNLSCSPERITLHNKTDVATFTGKGGDEGNYSWSITGKDANRCVGELALDKLSFSVVCLSNGLRTIILEDGFNSSKNCALQVSIPEYEEF